ncbi:hypothetical protein HPB49_021053 [Dermacentor silvarum]|uniref:Uncharacterized protein n=1 Tax=Dermacentor silvarum TaxID=543639 RepID=A0ACB8DKP3_DERSI|nr:hypothetical protein HPB49_021053 [Dermacentor silvarum]
MGRQDQRCRTSGGRERSATAERRRAEGLQMRSMYHRLRAMVPGLSPGSHRCVTFAEIVRGACGYIRHLEETLEGSDNVSDTDNHVTSCPPTSPAGKADVLQVRFRNPIVDDYTPLLDIPKEQGASPPLNTKGECGSEIVNGDQDGVAAFEQAEGAVKPKKRKVSSSVRCDPTVMELCEILSDLISQLNGPAPWDRKSAPLPASFFCQMDSRGRPTVRLSKREIIWIVYCMAKELTAAKTTELGYSVRTPTISYWRRLVRQAVSRSLSDHPRMGGSSERVQVGVFKLKFKGSDRDPFLILGLLAESTGELRLLHIADNDPDCVAQIVAKGVLPETKIFSSGGKEFSHIEAAKDEDGPMRLVHNTGSQNDGATTKSRSKRPNSFCNTQKILCLWRRVRSKLVMIGSSKDPTALQGYLDWFWWLSLNGIGHCKDPFLRLLEAIAKAYGE